MKKICLGLCGMLIYATIINADGFSEFDRELIGAKDFPFPPGQGTEGSIPEADGSETPDTASKNTDSYDDDTSSNSSQENGKSEKEYVPEGQQDGSDNNSSESP